jgi:hypothetical protein
MIGSLRFLSNAGTGVADGLSEGAGDAVTLRRFNASRSALLSFFLVDGANGLGSAFFGTRTVVRSNLSTFTHSSRRLLKLT